MRLLLYVPESTALPEDAEENMAATVIPGGTYEVLHTINDLSRRLRQPKDGLMIAVLYLTNRGDFLDVINIRHLFRHVRLIVVASDLDNETIALAHRLRPRYLTHMGGNFPAVRTVIDRMCQGYLREGQTPQMG